MLFICLALTEVGFASSFWLLGITLLWIHTRRFSLNPHFPFSGAGAQERNCWVTGSSVLLFEEPSDCFPQKLHLLLGFKHPGKGQQAGKRGAGFHRPTATAGFKMESDFQTAGQRARGSKCLGCHTGHLKLWYQLLKSRTGMETYHMLRWQQ